jgi:organic radical activating enzyme
VEVKSLVVCTGGEPLLQLDEPLIKTFPGEGFEMAIETNGTRLPPSGVDSVCVSPKAGSELVLLSGNELKLVFPQEAVTPERFESLRFEYFLLQQWTVPSATQIPA